MQSAEQRQRVDRALDQGEHPSGDGSALTQPAAPRAPPGPRLTLLPRRHVKVVHLIRHGQGFHNVVGELDERNYASWDHEDAHLTEKGWSQAAELKRHIAAAPIRPEVVIVSPLTRTLETAVGAFGGPVWHPGDAELPLMQEVKGAEGRSTAHPAVSARGAPPFVACELAREQLGEHPCDRRRPLAVYREQFPGVDLSQVETEEDVMWKADQRETAEEITARGYRFLQWLIERPESEIAVVSHSSILHHTLANFVGDATASAKPELDRLFGNCELRTMVLSDVSGNSAGNDKNWWHPDGLHKQNGLPNGTA